MVLVDTNVLLDLVTRDPVWLDWSRHQLDALGFTERLAINGVIYAELAASYTSIEALDAMLEQTSLIVAEIPRAALYLAGRVHFEYRRKGGTRSGVLSDFFVGAHAAVTGARLVTRDPAPYRRYFSTIDVIAPQVN